MTEPTDGAPLGAPPDEVAAISDDAAAADAVAVDGAAGDGAAGDDADMTVPSGEPTRSRVIAAVAVGTVAVVGLLGALLGGGGGDLDRGSSPGPAGVVTTVSATTGAETTAADTTNVATTVAATDPPPPTSTAPPTAPDSTVATATPVTTVLGGTPTTSAGDPAVTTTSVSAEVALVGRVVPDVTAFPELLDPVAQATAIAQLAIAERNDVASPGPVGSLCAVVRLREQAQLEGRWERDGREVDSTNLSTVGEPGFGDCLVGDGGAPLTEGAYQFIVADRDGNDSAAGTFVIGAVPLEQVFVNDTGQHVCTLRLAPSSVGRYDAYDFTAAPLLPGASVIVPVGDVDQDVRVGGCDPDADPIAEFDFNPAAGVPRAMTE